jgi:histidyl-tRNA synthetase
VDTTPSPPKQNLVEPRTLRGFRDLLPGQASYRTWCIERISATFRSFGFQPIVTPALEYAEVLKGKGSEDHDREMFEFRDRGGRDVGMRFDLTVPLARFVSEHHGQLTFPLRAYQIGPVWRGERPQSGRYREFVQCDADILGSESLAADAEIVAVFCQALLALEIRPFTIRVSDRRILAGVLEHSGVAVDPVAVLRTLDKVDRMPHDKVEADLVGLDVDAATARELVRIVTEVADNDTDRLQELEARVGGSETGKLAVDRLREVRTRIADLGVPDANVAVDPAVVRGLDYYTGVVFETTYHGVPSVGSICSGGRYDNLTMVYSKHRTPGVGASIGIDRLLHAVLEEEKDDPEGHGSPVVFGGATASDQAALFRAARELRAAGIAVDVHPETVAFKKVKQYATRRGSPLLVSVTDGEVRIGPPTGGAIDDSSLDTLVADVHRRLP